MVHNLVQVYVCVPYLATSPLYRDLYVQLAWSGLRSTQNGCPVGDWTSSNQEKRFANGAACDLEEWTETQSQPPTHIAIRCKIKSVGICDVNVCVSIPFCLLFPFEITGVDGFRIRPTAI